VVPGSSLVKVTEGVVLNQELVLSGEVGLVETVVVEAAVSILKGPWTFPKILYRISINPCQLRVYRKKEVEREDSPL
jgi:hypothetical protein